MKINISFTTSLLLSLSLFSYTDESHYSTIFGSTRFFRVFTPSDYNVDGEQRYPVIYYFHGCGGSYDRSGPYKYVDYGLTPPDVLGAPPDKNYDFPNNADLENLSTFKNVIIVCVDGRIPELPEGCQVYFPSQAPGWEGNYYNFSAYIRELIEVVDERYLTKARPQYRAVTGLSMGGHMATWVAATNPHLFSSTSQFCYGPNFYDVGEPTYQTTVDIRELWRNLKSVPFRHSTTNRDYLKFYSAELFSIYSGAGFYNEYFEADYCHHAAARMDLQVEFHKKYFDTPKPMPSCFSHINLYPAYEVWNYNVTSDKSEKGWIYLHNVTKDGMGIYTRKRFPWGESLPDVEVHVTTPALYQTNTIYHLSRYDYRSGKISTAKIRSNENGQLDMVIDRGMGWEVGILGERLQPPIFILSDTIHENIYLRPYQEKILNFDILNLSNDSQFVTFNVQSSDSSILKVTSQPNPVQLTALSKTQIDSFAICQSQEKSDSRRTAYLKITWQIDDVQMDRERILQVHIKNDKVIMGRDDIKIFDGKAEVVPLFKYKWNGWDKPFSEGKVEEGWGNGNGIPEGGEIFSIWIQTPKALAKGGKLTWHPSVPINNQENPDIGIRDVFHHRFSTGRDVLSAQLILKRSPTEDNPVRIPVQFEILEVFPLENDCHRNAADGFKFYFTDLLLYPGGVVVIDE